MTIPILSSLHDRLPGGLETKFERVPDLWLCDHCGRGGEEKGKTALVESRECDYCGARQNMPIGWQAMKAAADTSGLARARVRQDGSGA